jgi:hypothetical protein
MGKGKLCAADKLYALRKMREGGYTGSYRQALKNIEDSLNEKGIEGNVDEYLGSPQQKARSLSEITEIPYKTEHVDNIRHAEAGRLTAKAIEDKTGNIPYLSKGLGFLGSTAMGLGHELIAPKRDWRTGKLASIKDVIREAGEDIYSNTYGAYLNTFSDLTPEQQSRDIWKASMENRLPDGVVGEGNLYIGDRADSKRKKFQAPYKKENGGELPKYQPGGNTPTPLEFSPSELPAAEKAYADSSALHNDYLRIVGDMTSKGYKPVYPSNQFRDTGIDESDIVSHSDVVKGVNNNSRFFRSGDLRPNITNQTIENQLSHKTIKPSGTGSGQDVRQVFNYSNVKPRIKPVPEGSLSQEMVNHPNISQKDIDDPNVTAFTRKISKLRRTAQSIPHTEDVGTKPKYLPEGTMQMTSGDEERRQATSKEFFEPRVRRTAPSREFFEPRPGTELASFETGGEIPPLSWGKTEPTSIQSPLDKYQPKIQPNTKQRANELYKQIAPSGYGDLGNIYRYYTGTERDSSTYLDPRSEEGFKQY